MATLVLSTVGTALGGPVGAAIGALIGQSIDQQLLRGSKRGPRLGDLSVQTSSYGTQIPKIYGTMRVAGSVIWSTDLAESAATTGAKGQPDTVYSYCVSLAVALASRPISGIGRIWADGKLIRGDDGLFKVSTDFRFYDGSEQQEIDPLIGSVEGIGTTPAYRGLALAVFENLELAEFGNRIPFLTFEIIADSAAPTLAEIVDHASDGAIACGAGQQIAGFAAYGQSIRSAVTPLIEAFGIEVFDDGNALRPPVGDVPLNLGEHDLGNDADDERVPKMQREQLPAMSLPAALRLSFYDPARDFQGGDARATTGDQDGSEDHLELAAVLDANSAKLLSQRILARRWAGRDRLTLRLPPRHAALEPGAKLSLGTDDGSWTVQQCTLEGFVVLAELSRSTFDGELPMVSALTSSASTMMRAAVPTTGDVTLALFDAPLVAEDGSTQPTLLLAASSPTPGWRSIPVEINIGWYPIMAQAALRKTVLGRAISVLDSGEPHLIDMNASVDIELIDGEQWLVNCDDDALVGGCNLALIGGELIQFGEAVPIGPGQFQLRRLLRGRRGTEWAAPRHEAGDWFALIEPNTVRPIHVPDWATGATVSAASNRIPSSATGNIKVNAESVRPPAPVHVRAQFSATGDLQVTWVRRSRRGWAWVDEIDAPLAETKESYRVTIRGPITSLERYSNLPALTVDASDLASIGPGPASVLVRQVGDWAASRPVETYIILP